MRLIIFLFYFIIMSSRFSFAETVQIDFTADDSYSIEVAKIDVGDTIEWSPKNEGHNVEFLGGPDEKNYPRDALLSIIHYR